MDIQELVNQPRESLAVELKNWINPEEPTGIITLVKAAIAMRNNNGGFILIGFDNDTCQPIHEDVPENVQELFNKDTIQGLVTRYASEFFEVDPVVCEYVQNHTDPCVNKMFSRYVKGDGAVTALFPFKRLSHSFIVAGWPGHKFDPEKERESNNNMRIMLKRTKKNVLALVDRENPDAIRKAEHYTAALDAQLEMCKKTDEAIDMLGGAL